MPVINDYIYDIVKKSGINILIDEDVLQDLFLVAFESIKNDSGNCNESLIYNVKCRIEEFLNNRRKRLNLEKRVFSPRSLDSFSFDGKSRWIDSIADSFGNI